MTTHECPVVSCHVTHQSRSRMASTLQLTHIICSKGCGWRDVDFCTGMQSIYNTANSLSFRIVAIRKKSNTAVLMKLLLAIEVHVTTTALSSPLPARVLGSSRPSTLPVLPVAMALKSPWNYPGQSTVEFGGGALKTGRVAGALVQCPKLCQYISQIAVN